MPLRLYHPDLEESVEVKNERQAKVLKKSGWTTEAPKKRLSHSEQIEKKEEA